MEGMINTKTLKHKNTRNFLLKLSLLKLSSHRTFSSSKLLQLQRFSYWNIGFLEHFPADKPKLRSKRIPIETNQLGSLIKSEGGTIGENWRESVRQLTAKAVEKSSQGRVCKSTGSVGPVSYQMNGPNGMKKNLVTRYTQWARCPGQTGWTGPWSPVRVFTEHCSASLEVVKKSLIQLTQVEHDEGTQQTEGRDEQVEHEATRCNN